MTRNKLMIHTLWSTKATDFVGEIYCQRSFSES